MIMRILDRERYWAFLKAYLICFFALVGLYVVIDAFSNLDEFGEWADSTPQLFYNMGRFYLIRMSLIYDQICGIITMMAAIFTVTWMQKNNELLAMLAAGISTQRIIRPVLISAVLVSSLAIINQEYIMPPLAEELQRTQDDNGVRKVKVYMQEDLNEVFLKGDMADRATQTVTKLEATILPRIAGKMIEISGRESTYIPPETQGVPYSGGWLLRDVRFLLPMPETESLNNLTHGILSKVEDISVYPKPMDEFVARPNVVNLFLQTELSFATMTRSRHWYQFAGTVDLIRAISNPTNLGDRDDIQVFLHGRLIRPLLGLNLMFLSLPLVLSGTGRNMFVNLGMSLGTSGIFYSANFMSQYLGSHGVMSAELAAWAPLIGFGTIAAARWGSIRT